MTIPSPLIEFVVKGEPIGKGRPRFSYRSNSVYTPQKTKDAESSISKSARSAMEKSGIFEPISGVPVWVSIKFFLKAPKKIQTLFPLKRPDLDNMAKLVCDAMNKIVFSDDCIIAQLHCSKFWSDNPSTEISVWKLPLKTDAA